MHNDGNLYSSHPSLASRLVWWWKCRCHIAWSLLSCPEKGNIFALLKGVNVTEGVDNQHSKDRYILVWYCFAWCHVTQIDIIKHHKMLLMMLQCSQVCLGQLHVTNPQQTTVWFDQTWKNDKILDPILETSFKVSNFLENLCGSWKAIFFSVYGGWYWKISLLFFYSWFWMTLAYRKTTFFQPKIKDDISTRFP